MVARCTGMCGIVCVCVRGLSRGDLAQLREAEERRDKQKKKEAQSDRIERM